MKTKRKVSRKSLMYISIGLFTVLFVAGAIITSFVVNQNRFARYDFVENVQPLEDPYLLLYVGSPSNRLVFNYIAYKQEVDFDALAVNGLPEISGIKYVAPRTLGGVPAFSCTIYNSTDGELDYTLAGLRALQNHQFDIHQTRWLVGDECHAIEAIVEGQSE